MEGISLSVADKMAMLGHIEAMGADYIEGGWPGAIPRDTEFFNALKEHNPLTRATITAFGSTTKAHTPAAEDAQVAALVESEAPVVCLVAKSDIRHVGSALRTTEEENLRMVRDTVSYLTGLGREVMVDMEHFFDGFAINPDYTTSVVAEAFRAGATWAILCDTNGGTLPTRIGTVVSGLQARLAADGVVNVRLGIHTHDDAGCAVANTIAGVEAGCRQIQGTINGYGERTGNANLLTAAANLALKTDFEVVSEEELAEFTSVSHAVAELTNMAPQARQPYVGHSSFAHKAGLHASAIRVDPNLYQHTEPARVGNDMRMLVSDMAGRSSVELKCREFGIDLTGRAAELGKITERVKAAEAAGYTYDAADASFELLVREILDGRRIAYFDVEQWATDIHSVQGQPGVTVSEARVKLHAGGQRIMRMGEGVGPVHALDQALRAALTPVYAELEWLELTDFKVRILDSSRGTRAVTRVLLTMRDEAGTWTTVGVGEDVIEAAWEALTDGYVYGFLRSGHAPV
ncbi:citramalate synthase [Trueperella pecoris]